MDRIENKPEKRASQRLWSRGDKLVSSKKHSHSNDKTSPQTSPVLKKTPKDWNLIEIETASTRSVVSGTSSNIIQGRQKQKSPQLNLTELGEISPFGGKTQFNCRGTGTQHSNKSRSFFPRPLVIYNSAISPVKSAAAGRYCLNEYTSSSTKPSSENDNVGVQNKSSNDDWKSPSPEKPSTSTCKGPTNACFSSQDVRYCEFLAMKDDPSQLSAASDGIEVNKHLQDDWQMSSNNCSTSISVYSKSNKNFNSSQRRVVLSSQDDQSPEKTNRCFTTVASATAAKKQHNNQRTSSSQNNQSKFMARASFKTQNYNSNRRDSYYSSQDVRNPDINNQTRRLSQNSNATDGDLSPISSSPSGSASSKECLNLNENCEKEIVTSEDIFSSEHVSKINKPSKIVAKPVTTVEDVTRIAVHVSDRNALPTTNKTATSESTSFKRHHNYKCGQDKVGWSTPDDSVNSNRSSKISTAVEGATRHRGAWNATKHTYSNGDLSSPYKRHHTRWETSASSQDPRDIQSIKQATKFPSRRSYPDTCSDSNPPAAIVTEANERHWHNRQQNFNSESQGVTTSKDRTTAVNNSPTESTSSTAMQQCNNEGKMYFNPQDSSYSGLVKEAKKPAWIESFSTAVKMIAATNERRHNAWKTSPFLVSHSTATTSSTTLISSKPSTNQWRANSLFSQDFPAFQYVDPATTPTESTTTMSQQRHTHNKWRTSYSPQNSTSSESANVAKRHCWVVSPDAAAREMTATNEHHRVIGKTSPLVASTSTTPNGSTAFTNQWRSSLSPLQNVPAFQYNKQSGAPSSKLPYIDTHCHLDLISKRFHRINTFGEFELEFDFPDNFKGCVAIFCYPKDWLPGYGSNFMKKMLSHKRVWGAVGCHPKDASSFDGAKIEILKSILSNPKVVAVGEMGLDYSKQHFQDQQILQKEVFRKQLDIAKSFNKPVVVHCRDAEEDAIEVLKESGHRNTRIHRHCFTEGWQEAERWLEEFPNCYLGITCIITKWDRQPRLVEAIRHTPLNRLLLETDAPYFVPKSVISEVNYSVPCMALDVAVCIAEIKGLTLDQVLEVTWQNSLKMYGLQIDT